MKLNVENIPRWDEERCHFKDLKKCRFIYWDQGQCVCLLFEQSMCYHKHKNGYTYWKCNECLHAYENE